MLTFAQNDDAMRYKFFFSIGAMLALLVACQSGGNQQEQLLEEVMADHDSIMPKVGLFVRYNMALDSVIEQLPHQKSINPTLDTMAERARLLEIKGTLEDATENMNNWMVDFEPDQSDKTEQEAINYLKSEKDKLELMKTQFHQAESLARANPLKK